MKPKRILVADNDRFFVEFLSEILTKRGYETIEAYDGKEAIERLQEGPVDIVFVDLVMPKIRGERVIEYIRKKIPTQEVHIIVMSGILSERQELAHKVPADFFIVKGPIEKMHRHVVNVIDQIEEKRPLVRGPKDIIGLEDVVPRKMVTDLTITRDYYESILASLGEGVAIFDTDMKILYVNPAALAMTQKTTEEVINCPITSLWEHGDVETVLSMAKKISDESCRKPVSATLSHGLKTIKAVVTRLMVNDTNQGGVMILQDITDLTQTIRELKETQKQLFQAAKFSALGDIAAHMSEEMNAPIISILSYVAMTLNIMDKDDPMRSNLEIIQEEALRAKNLVQDLIDFARKGEGKQEEVNINTILSDIMTLLGQRAKNLGIDLKERLTKELPLIRCETDLIKQVFYNLINNAFEAMPEGGTLSISTQREGRWLKASLSDTGPGIPEDSQSMVFEPFFGAERDKEASGLGLSVSLKIVKQFGGDIKLDSRPGEGATFTVILPVSEEG